MSEHLPEEALESGLILATPVLKTNDMEATLTHFNEVLGFDVESVYGEPPTAAFVNRDEAYLCLVKSKTKLPKGKDDEDFDILIWSVKPLEELYKELQDYGADIVKPPSLNHYGVWALNVRDNNGYIISFVYNDPGEEEDAYEE